MQKMLSTYYHNVQYMKVWMYEIYGNDVTVYSILNHILANTNPEGKYNALLLQPMLRMWKYVWIIGLTK